MKRGREHTTSQQDIGDDTDEAIRKTARGEESTLIIAPSMLARLREAFSIPASDAQASGVSSAPAAIESSAAPSAGSGAGTGTEVSTGQAGGKPMTWPDEVAGTLQLTEGEAVCPSCSQTIRLIVASGLCRPCDKLGKELGHAPSPADLREYKEREVNAWARVALELSEATKSDAKVAQIIRVVKLMASRGQNICSLALNLIMNDMAPGVLMLASQAHDLLQALKTAGFVDRINVGALPNSGDDNLYHVVCSRVVDWWNITEDDFWRHGYCYYSMSHGLPRTKLISARGLLDSMNTFQITPFAHWNPDNFVQVVALVDKRLAAPAL